MDEVLLGRPLLNTLGVNLIDQLKIIEPLINYKNAKDIDSNESKFGSARYRGLSYMSADDDPIECLDTICAGIGKDSQEKIGNDLKNILENSNTAGPLENGYHDL